MRSIITLLFALCLIPALTGCVNVPFVPVIDVDNDAVSAPTEEAVAQR